MARLRRAVPLSLALLLGACAGTDGPTPKALPAPTTTTVTVATTTTTTSPPEPTRSPRRTSRAAEHRAPPTTALAPPVRSSADDVPCWLWPEGANRSRRRSDECWRPLLERFTDWPVGRMLAILYCESHGNAWVVNGNHRNLLQIADATAGDDEEHKLTTAHIELAHAMWAESGTSPWSQCGG